MGNAKRLGLFMGGCAAAGIVAIAGASITPAHAAKGKGRKRGALMVQSINVTSEAGVPANRIVEITFNHPVDPASVSPATLFVRSQNATQTGYTKQVFGSIQVVGNVVRFYPRLPTHLRDANGEFYPQGHALDDAAANSGFKPSTGYEVRAIGKPFVTTIRSTAGKPLKLTTSTRFTTAAATPPEKLWTTQSYADSPPPQFSFSNPPDMVPAAASQYATHGGAQDVPNSVLLSLFCTKVPLAPGTARIQGNVEMTMLARRGDYSLRRPVEGSVFVEQNFDTTLLAFRPRVALADIGIYSLRVSKGVKDLTEQNDFSVNRQRERLRQIYDFLSAGRALSPGVPWSQLPDPPAELITDWPKLEDPNGVAARGVLKVNVLNLGDAYPDEIDPRVMLLFTTQDEPATEDSVTVEFTKSENLYDSNLSTGEVDTSVPSAASATFTVAGGSGALGDLLPTSNRTIPTNGQPLDYRNIVIPPNVVVTFTGNRPVTVRGLSIVVNGEISVRGGNGDNADQLSSSTYTRAFTSAPAKYGAAGGPGGGKGGDGATTFGTTSGSPVRAGNGTPGNDVNGIVATAQDGGRGGFGGFQATSSAYAEGGGGGGGGGIRTAGTAGATGTAPYASWNGASGAGGAAAIGNDDLDPMVGGAGGGAGGTGGYMYPSYNWGEPGGGGGGGGGAITLQTAGSLTIGTTGAIRARGGAGGNGGGYYSGWTVGPGGGGGGGSILLRSTKGFNIANPTISLDVAGGPGGTQSGSYVAPYGGAGGSGLVRTEDPNGGVAFPGATQGTFSPVGAGVPSFVYTKWVDLGVQDPRILPFTAASIPTTTANDAIYVQAQMTREHATLFGTPDLTALNSVTQNSNNVAVMSQWTPIKVHDETGVVGGAFTASLGPIPGLPASPPKEYAGFDVGALNGKGYRFVRFRIYFQLDSTHTASSPLPSVERIITAFQFNF